MSDPFASLETLLAHVWARLADGAREADDPFRLVCLATTGARGAEARMVALRRADRAAGDVEVHSDVRTAKVHALEVDPRAALLAWDPETRLQVRLSLDTLILSGDPERWARIPAGARLNYGTDPAPGTALPDPASFSRMPEISRFAVLLGKVRAIDAVSLAHDPHRRGVFDVDGARWVAP